MPLVSVLLRPEYLTCALVPSVASVDDHVTKTSPSLFAAIDAFQSSEVSDAETLPLWMIVFFVMLNSYHFGVGLLLIFMVCICQREFPFCVLAFTKRASSGSSLAVVPGCDTSGGMLKAGTGINDFVSFGTPFGYVNVYRVIRRLLPKTSAATKH